MPRSPFDSAAVLLAVTALALASLAGCGVAASSPSPTATHSVPSTPAPPSLAPIATPPAATPYPDGIPAEIGGMAVLRGAELRARIASADDATPFLAGGGLERFTPRCRPPSAMETPAELELLPPCGAGEVFADAGGPFITLIGWPAAEMSWGASKLVVVRVHVHDPRADRCRLELQARCGRALVMDEVVWRG